MNVKTVASNSIGDSVPSPINTVYLPIEIPIRVIDSLEFGQINEPWNQIDSIAGSKLASIGYKLSNKGTFSGLKFFFANG